MAKFQDNMTDIFDLPVAIQATEILEAEVVEDNTPTIALDTPPAIPLTPEEKQAKDDYDFVRKNLLDTIAHARLALDEINNIASVTEQPRAFEVYAKLIDTINQANNNLLELHSKFKKLKEQTNSSSNSTDQSVTNNSIFVGSTSDLAKLIKDQQKIS